MGLRLRTKFQGQFLDRDVLKSLNPVTRRFLTRVGGAIRLTAKRSLRPAAQVAMSDLTAVEQREHKSQVELYRAGKLTLKPRRREKIAAPGNPPLLHTKPKSPLRELIFFAYDPRTKSVVVGPMRSKSLSLESLEDSHPFMRPAFNTIKPRFPQYLKQAAR